MPKIKRNSEQGYTPDSIDFRGVNFTRISVTGDDHNHDMLLNILKQTKPVTMEPYASVERLLQTQGQKVEANKIYDKMQWQWLYKISPK